jgi:uncharacterized membrane protein YkoI
MKRCSHVLGMALSVSLLAPAAFAQGEQQQPEEEQMPSQQPTGEQQQQQLEGVPQAARSTIQQHVGKGEIKSVERKQRDERTVYEVEFRGDDGKSHTILVDSEGKLVEKQYEGD